MGKTRLVQRLAARGPLLWVVEDLHWADRSTRDLLADLATTLRSGRVLVVGTFRSDELHRRHPLRRLLAELARNRRVARLELARFSRAELTQQVAGLVGADPPARLVDDLYARSGGNPFFAEELVLAGNGGAPGVLSPSLQEVLLVRVVRLGDRTQQLLRVAAAAGPGVTQPLLAAVAGLDDQQLLAGLHEAVDQQLLVPDPGGGQGYVFRHALLAEAVYAELLWRGDLEQAKQLVAEAIPLVAAGRSNPQIAQALFISPKTVGVHVSNILAKLGVAGRVEAAAIAHRLGLD